MVQGCPPPLGLVCASTVQVANPGEAKAMASNVKTTLSPVSRAVPPPLAVTLMVPDDSVELHDADGTIIWISPMTVNPVGVVTIADPTVVLIPVFVMVIVYETTWFAVAEVGDMVAVKVGVFACTSVNTQNGMTTSEISMLATTASRNFLRSIGNQSLNPDSIFTSGEY